MTEPGTLQSLQPLADQLGLLVLPGKVVEQMYDNGKRKLPERYRVLLEEYFRRLPLSEGQ